MKITVTSSHSNLLPKGELAKASSLLKNFIKGFRKYAFPLVFGFLLFFSISAIYFDDPIETPQAFFQTDINSCNLLTRNLNPNDTFFYEKHLKMCSTSQDAIKTEVFYCQVFYSQFFFQILSEQTSPDLITYEISLVLTNLTYENETGTLPMGWSKHH